MSSPPNEDESSRETVRERPIHRSHLLVRHLFWKRSPFPATSATTLTVYIRVYILLPDLDSFFFPLPPSTTPPRPESLPSNGFFGRARSIDNFFPFSSNGRIEAKCLAMFREIEIERRTVVEKVERASLVARRSLGDGAGSGFSRIPARFQSAERAARA